MLLGIPHQFLAPFAVLFCCSVLGVGGYRRHSWGVKLIFQSSQLLSDCTVSGANAQLEVLSTEIQKPGVQGLSGRCQRYLSLSEGAARPDTPLFKDSGQSVQLT